MFKLFPTVNSFCFLIIILSSIVDEVVVSTMGDMAAVSPMGDRVAVPPMGDRAALSANLVVNEILPPAGQGG